MSLYTVGIVFCIESFTNANPYKFVFKSYKNHWLLPIGFGDIESYIAGINILPSEYPMPYLLSILILDICFVSDTHPRINIKTTKPRINNQGNKHSHLSSSSFHPSLRPSQKPEVEYLQKFFIRLSCCFHNDWFTSFSAFFNTSY